jgi:hypothetical protein
MLAGHLSGVGPASIWEPNIGDVPAAIASLETALPSFEELWRGDDHDVRVHSDLGGVIATLAATTALRDAAASILIFERALAVFEKMPAAMRDDYYVRQNEWFVHCAMASPLLRVGRKDAARTAAEHGLAMATALGDDSRGGAVLEMCRALVADTYRDLGEPARAIQLHEANIASLTERSRGGEPPQQYLIGLVASYQSLAALLPERACELATKAAEVWRTFPRRTEYVSSVQATLDARVGSCKVRP